MSDTKLINDLMPLKIELAIKYAEFFIFPFYIKKKSNEFIEISQKSTGLKQTFRGYKERGLELIYLKPEHYEEIVSNLKVVLKQAKNFKEAFHDLDLIFSSVQNQIKKNGLSGNSIDRCKEINTLVIEFVTMIPSLSDIVSEVKLNNKNLFYQYVFKSFVAICMLETFDWHSDLIKNKIGQACLLMDINLTDNDLVFMQDNPKDSWPQHTLNHPTLNADTVKNASNKISHDVLQIIELHHELPDGAGYPRGVDSHAIPLLASLVIVADFFTAKILVPDFKPEQKEKLLKDMDIHFSKGIFRTAKDALIIAINKN